MHLLFPSHVWRSSLCKPKRLNVCSSVSSLSSMLAYFLNMISCVDLLAFLFYLCNWHSSTFNCHHDKNKACVIQLLHAQLNPKEDLNAAHSSCLFSRLLLEINKWASDALMMQMLQVLACDSMGRWFVWLTQLAMIQRWWMRPSFSGDPERWGWQKGYLRFGWLQLTGWPTFASCGWMSTAKIKTKGHFTCLMMTV